MSARDLVHDVGQLMWLGFEGTEVPDWLRADIAGGKVGLVILFKRNLAHIGELIDLDAVAALNRSLHGAGGDPPLLVAVDQEGGRVQRVRAPATRWPPMHAFAGLDDQRALALARSVGRAMALELAALGFDVDFAPVLDVHTNPDNPIIGDRSFSTEAAAAADRALAFADGMASAGIISCGKHFPGHGDTTTDSHLALPRLDHDLDRLRTVELAPFRRAAAAGLPMLMTAHVVFAALDADRPATLSPAVIDRLLRGELGYRGVVVSDDLDMKAVADHYPAAEAAVAAVAAGCDALLLCRERAAQVAAFEGLVRAAEASSAVRARIGEAAQRVRRLKRERPAVDPAATRAIIACQQHRSLAAELAEAAS